MRRSARTSVRGMTLLEALVSVLVLVVGVAALMGMIINVENANRSMALQHNSLDIFARISAQIRDAECDFVPGVGLSAATSDPAFLPGGIPDAGANGQWIEEPLNLSTITLVGTNNTNPELAQYVPAIQVAYRVNDPLNIDTLPSFQIDVQIRQIMRDPVQDDIERLDGYWIRVYPIQKMCNGRADATQRGEY